MKPPSKDVDQDYIYIYIIACIRNTKLLSKMSLPCSACWMLALLKIWLEPIKSSCFKKMNPELCELAAAAGLFTVHWPLCSGPCKSSAEA